MSELSKLKCKNILNHILECEIRFQKIRVPEDFINSEEGQILLDAISMRLQAIGENIKGLIKTDPTITKRYNKVDWKEVVRFRDFISHHYESLDYVVVFDIGKIHLPALKDAIEREMNSI